MSKQDGTRWKPEAEAPDLLTAVITFAAAHPTITAVALLGSHARGSARPDSDVDLLLLADEPQRLLADRAWLGRFGEPLSVQEEDWGAVTSLRVRYRRRGLEPASAMTSALEVEFGLSTPAWANVPVDAGTRRVVADGMVILYDPAGVLARLRQAVSG